MKKNHLWIGFLLVLAIWYIMHLFIDARLVPDPVDTMLKMAQLIVSGELLIHILSSLLRLLAAVSAALLLGTMTGVLMGLNKLTEKIMAPFMYVMFPVPKAALLPILFILFGLGDLSKIILIWLILFFQIGLSVYDAVKSIGDDIFLSAKTLRLNRFQLFRHVVLPAIMPSLLSSLKTSVGIGIAVLFFAETYATDQGLGYFIMNHWSLLNYEEMYSGILLLGAIGYFIFRCIDYLRFRLVKWT